jgi:hypothetical protein
LVMMVVKSYKRATAWHEPSLSKSSAAPQARSVFVAVPAVRRVLSAAKNWGTCLTVVSSQAQRAGLLSWILLVGCQTPDPQTPAPSREISRHTSALAADAGRDTRIATSFEVPDRQGLERAIGAATALAAVAPPIPPPPLPSAPARPGADAGAELQEAMRTPCGSIRASPAQKARPRSWRTCRPDASDARFRILGLGR